MAYKIEKMVGLAGLIIVLAPLFSPVGLAFGVENEAKAVFPLVSAIIETEDVGVANNTVHIEPIIAKERIGRGGQAHGVRFKGTRNGQLNRVIPGQNGVPAMDNTAATLTYRTIEFGLIEHSGRNFDSSVNANIVSGCCTAVFDEKFSAVLRGAIDGLWRVLLPRTVIDGQVSSQLALSSFVGEFDSLPRGVSGILGSDGGFLNSVVRLIEYRGLPENAASREYDKTESRYIKPVICAILSVLLFTIGWRTADAFMRQVTPWKAWALMLLCYPILWLGISFAFAVFYDWHDTPFLLVL